MNKDVLIDYVTSGREIEFKFKGKKYSITYAPEEAKEYISFCEFYQKPTNVATAEELLQVASGKTTVLQMWESLSEDDVWVF